jgi:hypothetical protein
MSLARRGGPMYPEIIIEAEADGGRAEYSYRVNGGFWRPFSPNPRLVVHDPALLLVGKHTIEVRARTPGNYRTLDPTPARVDVVIEPPAGAGERFELPPVDWGPAVHIEPGDTELTSATIDGTDDEPLADKTGCACGHRPAATASSLGFLLVLFLLRRSRKHL